MIQTSHISKSDQQKARLDYIRGNQSPILDMFEDECDTAITKTGADRDKGDPSQQVFRENWMETTLGIPTSLQLNAAHDNLKQAFINDPISYGSYYDDQKTQSYALPYNKENALNAAETLLKAGETNWLDEKFSVRHYPGREAINPIGMTETTGRQVLHRISLDLNYPEKISFAHLVAITIPFTDNYWKTTEKYIEANSPKTPLFPGGGPPSPNVINCLDMNQYFHLTPSQLVETIELTRSLNAIAKKLTGEKDPFQILDLQNHCEAGLKCGIDGMEKYSPRLKPLLCDYLETGNLQTLADKLQKLDEEIPGQPIGTELCSNYLLLQAIRPELAELTPDSMIMRLKAILMKPEKTKDPEPSI